MPDLSPPIEKTSRLKRCGVIVAMCGMVSVCAPTMADTVQSAKVATDFDNHSPIPHSTITNADGSGIIKAMLSCATSRYAHGVLGDAIEAGCLVVEDDTGTVFRLDLPENQVFEDLIPRIADVDSDGQNDVILVRSESQTGAALSVYTLAPANSDVTLTELASTPVIGTAYRWLAPVGIADFDNDGAQDIAYVQTPHIGGILRVWSIIDGDFKEIMRAPGFSNHSIGDTRVSTSKLQDVNDDGVMDIALPDQGRHKTLWVTLHPEYKLISTKPYSLSDFE